MKIMAAMLAWKFNNAHNVLHNNDDNGNDENEIIIIKSMAIIAIMQQKNFIK